MPFESAETNVVQIKGEKYLKRDRKIDRILTSKLTGFPIMLLLFMLIFYRYFPHIHFDRNIQHRVFCGYSTIKNEITIP